MFSATGIAYSCLIVFLATLCVGRAAEEAANVFYYLTYEGTVDLDAIEDPALVGLTLPLLLLLLLVVAVVCRLV